MKTQISFKHSLYYLIGLAFISLGVALSFRHGFGASGPDNMTYIISKVLTISLGTSNFLISSFFIILLMVVLRSWKFLFLFLQVFVLSPFIDLWDLVVLKDLIPIGYERFIVYGLSLSVIPLGCAFLIKSTYPASIYDELMFLTSRFTKLKFTVSRLVNESLLVFLALMVSLLTDNGYGSVNIGTLGYAFSVGFLIKFYLSMAELVTNRRKQNG